jgi:predicted Zn-dependent peptidase
MKRIGRVWTYTGEYRSLESELERINAVTLEELRDVANDFPIQPIVTAHLAPE